MFTLSMSFFTGGGGILQLHQHSTIDYKAIENYMKFHYKIMLVNVKLGVLMPWTMKLFGM